MLRSAGSSARGLPGRRSARTSAWMRASRLSPPGCDRVVVGDVLVRAEHELHLARVLAPGGEQPVVGERGGGRRRRGGRPARARRSCPTARARGGGGRRGPRARRRARAGRRGGRRAGGSGRRARGARAGRTSDGVGSQPLACGLEPLGGARLGEPRAQPAPQLRLPGGLVRQVDLAARPAADHRRAGAARSGRTARRGAGRSRSGARGGRRRPRGRGGSRGCAATARAGTRRRRRARARRRAAGDHGSVSGSTPDAVATASPTSRYGNGKSTFAHTPSERPGVAPRLADSRWVSQRSIPRVGTEMTSGANGSGSGSASSSPSAATRPSARSARWMCSIGHGEVARRRTTLTSDSVEQRDATDLTRSCVGGTR